MTAPSPPTAITQILTIVHDVHSRIATKLRIPSQPCKHGSMVGLRIPQKATGPVAAPSSDYGSDLDDETANELLSQAEYLTQPTVLLNYELEQDPVVQDAPPALQRTVLLKRSIEQSEGDLTTITPSESLRGPKIEVEYSEANRSTFSRMRLLAPALSI